jgi:alpha/beta superfamily hydrolase
VAQLPTPNSQRPTRTLRSALALALALAAPAAAERVTMTNASGARVVGEYRGAGAGAPGVLFFPMCRADAGDGWAPVAERLRIAGISSLIVRYRGYGGDPTPVAGDQRDADADAALAYLLDRVPEGRSVAVAGSSCGVSMALETARRHPARLRAVVAFTGPHGPSHIAHIRATPALAVLSGAAATDHPAPDWARELKAASANAASRVLLAPGKAHGTDAFRDTPALAVEIADWLAARLQNE